MQEDLTDGLADLTKCLHRHFISLTCWQDDDYTRTVCGGKPKIHFFSCFVVEIDGDWRIVTAGHIFGDIVRASDAKFSNWSIDDCAVSSNPQPPIPIPLDIKRDVFFLDDDVPGMDYAVIKISTLARAAMAKEGICVFR